uniref:ATP synthase subunit a n=1 Tax=Embiophila sp. TaxID=2931291 RepID=A0A8T9ZY47_9HEMI|nr:ATPase subunit 6 [Embiophila sp.]
MMTNLFSSFDPATSTNFSYNWMSSLTAMLIIPMGFWVIPSRNKITIVILQNKLHSEFKTLIKGSTGMTLLFTAIFTIIMVNNVMGLTPYTFTSTSHMTFNLALALPMWLSLMLFGWINQTQKMFAHLIPSGTPPILMPFMVCIETVSNMIRPGSLAVRLTANMIAGHLLMTLLGNSLIETKELAMPLSISSQAVLMMFELAVAMIQAYVFSVLSALYTSEVE